MTRRRKPTVRVFHRPDGWTLPDYSDLADCTTNFHREQNGQLPCTSTAVWKVVEDHGMHLTIGFYCNADLPEVEGPVIQRNHPNPTHTQPTKGPPTCP